MLLLLLCRMVSTSLTSLNVRVDILFVKLMTEYYVIIILEHLSIFHDHDLARLLNLLHVVLIFILQVLLIESVQMVGTAALGHHELLALRDLHQLVWLLFIVVI